MAPSWCIVLWLLTNWNNNSDATKQLTWVTSEILMPQYADGMAIGTYGDSIYLLGGVNAEYQLIGYNMTENKMVDFGLNYLRFAVSGHGQFYSVNNNIMYIIDGTISMNTLSTFDLETKTFRNYWNIPYNVGIGACIVSTDELLFILGGDNINMFQILSIENNKWMINGSSMLESRNYLSCNINIYSPNRALYAIGGYIENEETFEYLNTVEYLIMTDNYLSTQQWQYMDNHLLYPTESAQSVIYETYILVIGGQYYDEYEEGHYLDIIQVIDTVNGQITAGQMDRSQLKHIQNTAAIIVNQVIYIFSDDVYGNIPINIPTNAPTLSPSNAPTNAPTFKPNATIDSSIFIAILLGVFPLLIALIICYRILYARAPKCGPIAKEMSISTQTSLNPKSRSSSSRPNRNTKIILHQPMRDIDENKELVNSPLHEYVWYTD